MPCGRRDGPARRHQSLFPGSRWSHACNEDVPVHQFTRRTLHHRSAAGGEACCDRRGLLRPRLQVLQCRRRNPRGTRPRWRRVARNRLVPPRPLRAARAVRGMRLRRVMRTCAFIARRTATALMLMFAVSGAMAQAYPTKPVRMIVPFPAGGATDIVGRLIAQKLAEGWGQQVIVDNRGGAGGTIGSDVAAKSPPDGYTMLLGTSSTHAVAPSLYSKLPYDPVRDFSPVTLAATATILLAVHPSVPAQNVKELIALA